MIEYGSGWPSRPRFARDSEGVWLIIPAKEQLRGERLVEQKVWLNPDAVRELVIGGIHALEDESHADASEGFPNSSATLAYRYLKEAVLR